MRRRPSGLPSDNLPQGWIAYPTESDSNHLAGLSTAVPASSDAPVESSQTPVQSAQADAAPETAQKPEDSCADAPAHSEAPVDSTQTTAAAEISQKPAARLNAASKAPEEMDARTRVSSCSSLHCSCKAATQGCMKL